MQGARMLGHYVQHLAAQKGLSTSDLGNILNCSEEKVYSFFKGRAFASFNQLSALSKTFDISIQDLLKGDKDSYNTSVVHCMNQFDDTENREMILDIIDDYVDVVDATDD